MDSHPSVRPTIAAGIRDVLGVLTMVGIAGLVVAMMLGFEEANASMLWACGAMMLAAPVTALLHLVVTHGLTHDEKRIWLNEFASAQVWSALSEYLSSPNLSESARRRAQSAVARRTKK